tara:strand:- start:681 stop:1019 length:339 start_codon:yes stop_codon:yes gene_type:complete
MAYTKKFRDRNRFIFKNSDKTYSTLLEKKDISNLQQYATKTLPDIQKVPGLSYVTHVWKIGDRYFKLANQYYQRPELWWVIALYNKKPSESNVNIGDVILIPTPIDSILYYL